VDTLRGRLDTIAPFHLEATVRVLQRRPANVVDAWTGLAWRRVLDLPDGRVLLEVVDEGGVDAPAPRYTLRAARSSRALRAQAVRAIRRILALDVDPAPLLALAAREPHLRDVAAALRGMRPPRFAALFDAFMGVIPFQQLSIDAGIVILNRLVDRFGVAFPGAPDLRSLPSAEAIATARLPALRACGLSAPKARCLRDVALLIARGGLTEGSLEAMDSADALSRPRELPGVGPWSAALVLLRGLGRLDVFPPGDVGAQGGLRSLLRLAPDAPLDPVIGRFGALRGYLYFHAIGSRLLSRGLIRPAPARPRARRS
jgi:DNA-3-methyladenine glycosylase II